MPTLVVAMALVVVGLTSGLRDIGALLVLATLLLFFGGAAVLMRPRRRILDFDIARLPVDGSATDAFLPGSTRGCGLPCPLRWPAWPCCFSAR